MTALERPADLIAWDLRGYWIKGSVVTVTMTERCMIRTVVGKVRKVSVTGSWAEVDGWHLPTSDILRVARATVEDKDAYKDALRAFKAQMERERAEAKRRVLPE